MSVAIICSLLTLVYVALMLVYLAGWCMQKKTVLRGNYIPSTSITIIIPARNEAVNISNCIKAILAQDYPAGFWEVIVVDDHSEDGTADIVKAFRHPAIHCISLADFMVPGEVLVAYKKKAITAGISKGKGELIITTDADCIAGKNWLKHIAAVYAQERPVMMIAPVDFITDSNIVQQFQSLDFMSMQGITVASHRLRLGNMSNGANLAFSKEAYHAVNGYEGIDHLASGDDYLLMMKLQKAYPGKIACIKAEEAIVKTLPQPDWKSFLQQRVRWASKSGKYDDKKMTSILAFVYLYNLSFLILLLAGCWQTVFVMLCVKVIVEMIFLYVVSGFFNKRKQLFIFPFLQPVHIGYIILAGLLGFAGTYKWKGRSVR